MTIHEPRIARDCCRIMREHGFVPKTLINIGVGRCPEYEVWKEELPDTRLIGIDARARAPFWGGEYIHKALSDKAGVIHYCGRCRHCKCLDPNHRKKHHVMEADRLDTVIDYLRTPIELPLFIWMDADGSEGEIMRGGDWTFRRAKFLNCEIQNFPFAVHNADQMTWKLTSLGFTLLHHHEGTNDLLFVRKQ